MMKKNNIYLFVTTLLLLSGSLVSCNKFLDVQPKGTLPEDVQFSDEQGFKDALYGVYALMGDQALYGENLSYGFVDKLGQMFKYINTANLDNEITKYEYTNLNVRPIIDNIWASQYSTIAAVNLIIKHAETTDLTGETMDIIKGEAYALRAFLHFDLVRLFCVRYADRSGKSGIPYAFEADQNNKELFDIEGVYKNILADLDKAETLLQKDNTLNAPLGLSKDPYYDERYSELNKYADIDLKAVATAAVRQAKNQKEFLKRVKNEAGLIINVIPGTREAEYDFLGVINTLPIQNALIMDTGGASTELILVQNRKLQHLVSIPFGSVNLSERFLNPDVISAPEYFALSTFIHETFNSIWWLRRAQNLPIIALGGSNRTLAKIERRKEKMADFEAIHGYRMPTKQANAIFKEILGADLAMRESIPGLSKFRADIIVGGLMPVISMIRYLDSDRLTFSQFGLREGALYDHLNTRAVTQREH